MGGGIKNREKIVRDVLTGALPEGVPPSFKSVEYVTTDGRGNALEIVAGLTMFDNMPATVRLRRWSLGWSHQFTSLPGGPCSFECGEWRRVQAEVVTP